MATWILTASPENHEATAAHGFEVIGFEERRHPQALDVEPGDRFISYLTRASDDDTDVLLARMRARTGTPVA